MFLLIILIYNLERLMYIHFIRKCFIKKNVIKPIVLLLYSVAKKDLMPLKITIINNFFKNLSVKY